MLNTETFIITALPEQGCIGYFPIDTENNEGERNTLIKHFFIDRIFVEVDNIIKEFGVKNIILFGPLSYTEHIAKSLGGFFPGLTIELKGE